MTARSVLCDVDCATTLGLPAYTWAGIEKLKESDSRMKHLEEEVSSDVKVSNDIPAVVAEDTVSQVLISGSVAVGCYCDYDVGAVT